MGNQISSADRRRDIDHRLLKFGESLKCHEQYYEDGLRLSNKVFIKLSENSQYSRASFKIGGSFGKKTDVTEPDLDLVVLVNNCHPPLDDVLNDFERILRNNENYIEIRRGVYKKSARSLQFSFRNGISVDLLPATNLRGNERNDVIARMGQDENFAYFYNPSFVKDQIAFMKAQESFAHTLVRLSKFWFKSLHLDEGFDGGSAMMELIAVAAAEREEETGERSTSRGFIRVLDMVINLNTTKIAFEKMDNGQWNRVPSAELHIGNARQLVPKTVGSSRILQQQCFIVDPANPFQNFLEDKSESVFEKLNAFARKTRRVLSKILNGNGRDGEDKFIPELFEPLFLENATVSAPTKVLVSFDVPCATVYNKLKNRNVENMVSQQAKAMKKTLLTLIHSTVKGNENASVSDVGESVSTFLENELQLPITETSDFENHNEEYDVMVRVPYEIDNERYAVYVSMSWQPNDYKYFILFVIFLFILYHKLFVQSA